MTLEQEIALALERNNLSFNIIRHGNTEEVQFVQYTPPSLKKIGSLTYEKGIGNCSLTDINGFDYLRTSFTELLSQIQGDISHKRFDPIHDACNKVEFTFGSV